MNPSKKSAPLRALMFLTGIAAMLAMVAAADFIAPRLPGPAGEMVRRNIGEGIEATALIYTESGDARDYLVPGGKYATRAGHGPAPAPAGRHEK